MVFVIHPIVEPMIASQILLFLAVNSLWIFVYYKYRKTKAAMKEKFTPPVSIIIPSYNKGRLLKKTIDAVLNLDYPKKEVIVVNDGSTDNSDKICKKYLKEGKIKYIRQRRAGKAKALNAGIGISSHDIIVTVDADSLPKKDSLRKLVKYFVDKKVGAVAGSLNVARSKSYIVPFQALEYIFMNFQRLCQGFLSAILICPGPLSAFRREAIEKAGYFSDDTLVEDFDMTISIQKAGYKVSFAWDAKVFTYAPAKILDLWRQRLRWGRGAIQILKKHHDVVRNKNTKMIGIFSFPLHVLWVVLPVMLMSSFLLYALPNFVLTFYESVVQFSLALLPINSIPEFYTAVQKFIIGFLDLGRMNAILALGYTSVMIYLGLILTSYRSMSKNFRPKDLKTIMFIALYWMMLTTVFLYAIALELSSKRKKW